MKTTGTIVERLRRERVTNLDTIQDLAGLRSIVSGGLAAQDALVARIDACFADSSRSRRVFDRRAAPSHGYRAVHVIVYVDGLPVEVQVRTVHQDAWAQMMERLADRVGRQVRYGGEPDPDAYGRVAIRQKMLGAMQELSEHLAVVEEWIAKADSEVVRLKAARDAGEDVTPADLPPSPDTRVRDLTEQLAELASLEEVPG